jgi:hypothetical protein
MPQAAPPQYRKVKLVAGGGSPETYLSLDVRHGRQLGAQGGRLSAKHT